MFYRGDSRPPAPARTADAREPMADRCVSRTEQTLRVTPAIAAGISDHVWEIDELIALMPTPVARPWEA